jgi:hypothetical protein
MDFLRIGFDFVGGGFDKLNRNTFLSDRVVFVGDMMIGGAESGVCLGGKSELTRR